MVASAVDYAHSVLGGGQGDPATTATDNFLIENGLNANSPAGTAGQVSTIFIPAGGGGTGLIRGARAIGTAVEIGLAKAARATANTAQYARYRALAQNLHVWTPPNGAVFWSGSQGRAAAEVYARTTGRQTLEMTPGGRWLDRQRLFAKDSPLTLEQAHKVWGIMAERYAMSASGDVVAFTIGKTSQQFWRIELPALQDNPEVTGIAILERAR